LKTHIFKTKQKKYNKKTKENMHFENTTQSKYKTRKITSGPNPHPQTRMTHCPQCVQMTQGITRVVGASPK
jgi:hypothetical protein